MKTLSKLLFLFIPIIFYYACSSEKNDQKFDNAIQEIPSETKSDNGQFEIIDGVSQAPEIIDFDIEDVTVIDGRLVFEDHDALIKAEFELCEHNQESILAWGKKIGFTSLYSELVRIQNIDRNEWYLMMNTQN